MTTLVTGSNGLVGSAVQSLELENFFFASREHADLRDFEQTMNLFSSVKPTRVLHLAALVGGIGGNQINTAEYFIGNIQINLNTLEAARLHGVTSLVSFMSTCVFPDQTTYPLRPENLHAGPPHPSNFGYAYAKRMLEVQTRAYRLQWGLNYVIGVPTNIYGPHDNFDLNEGHVVPALIHKVWKAKKSGKPLEVWGSGNPLREFVYSKDIARLAIWMLDNYNSANPLILSNNKETSIQELVKIIIAKMKFQGKVHFNSSKPDGQFRKPSDSSELVRLTNGFEFTELDSGIDSTVEWFQNNYPSIRGI